MVIINRLHMRHTELRRSINISRHNCVLISCLCADFKTGLNEALEMHLHPLPTPDEIFARLNQVVLRHDQLLDDFHTTNAFNEKSIRKGKQICCSRTSTLAGHHRCCNLPILAKSMLHAISSLQKSCLRMKT